MHEALFYSVLKDKKISCYLCPSNCLIQPDGIGDCKVRINRNGVLVSEVYGRLEAMNLDPVEKKALFHFYPGTKILSVGTAGCNLHCSFCQNHPLSQCGVSDSKAQHFFAPEDLVDLARQTPHNIGLAFTYNEPTVNYEFMLSAAINARSAGLHTAMISNGYINPEPLRSLLEPIEAFNIDLKSFSNKFYKTYCKGKLNPILKTIKQIAESSCHLELTTLVIPGLNDDLDEFEQLCQWIANETGSSTVLHLSRYFPGYQLKLNPTPAETLFRMYDLAKNFLHHVYLGNLFAGDHGDTFCPHCNRKLIERDRYRILPVGMDEQGACEQCKTEVIKHYFHEYDHS